MKHERPPLQATPEQPSKRKPVQTSEKIDATLESHRQEQEVHDLEIRIKQGGSSDAALVRPSASRLQEYQTRYLPKYLQNQTERPAPLGWAFQWLQSIKEKFGLLHVEGREHIPQKGPFLVVANHRGGETGALYGLLRNYPVRIAAGEMLNWKRSPFRAWLLRVFGMLSVRESLSHLSNDEQRALLDRVPGKARKHAYSTIMERETDPQYALANAAARLRFVREAVATLSRGNVVAVFPEGPFLYEGDGELRQAYGGIEVIVREYERLTGQELRILPVGIAKRMVAVGECFSAKTSADTSVTDMAMQKIASLIPKKYRGYYG